MSIDPVEAFIGFGANLGDPACSIRSAARAVAATEGVHAMCLSRLFRSPAWGMTDQPDFVNAVARVSTTLAAQDLLARLLHLECTAGRDRTSGVRWGPRALDLDLLLYGRDVIRRDGLQVPHPRMHERAFVLVPLSEVAPEIGIPGRGLVADLLAGMETSRIEAIG